jgi:hypothetical protein
MSTFINLGIISLTERFNEIDLILNEAKKHSENNQDLYDALCRSAQVLLIAHFEGYLKELVQNVLKDINHFSSFKVSNKSLKRNHCSYFVDPLNENSKLHNQKILELIKLFDNLDTKFNYKYFFSSNKNPKVTVINNIAEYFGIRDFIKYLSKTNLDLVFSNTNKVNIKKCLSIKKQIIENTEEYPYKIKLTIFKINENKILTNNMWDTFISDILKRRHDIAHGTEIENVSGHTIIESDKVKLQILIYSITAFICFHSNPVPSSID